jgi:membrane-associated protease RseP (regulator of RpoE activity)
MHLIFSVLYLDNISKKHLYNLPQFANIMVSGWFEKYGLVLAFYILIIALIYIYRAKFEFQGKIVAIFKTKVGISLMQKIADKWPRLIRFLGVIGIYVGFAGMLLMIYFIFLGFYQMIFVPNAPPMFSPVLPGVSIPGSPIKLPLFEGIIALFIVVVAHEFSHGVISKAYKIPIKSSGLVMFGPIPGAFVEPDEKKLRKAKTKAQLSIFAGGPFANILLTLLILVLMLGISALSISMYEPDGISIDGFTNETEAMIGGRLENLSEGEVIYSINEIRLTSAANLSSIMKDTQPGDTITITTNKGTTELLIVPHPENESASYLGIYPNNHMMGKNSISSNKVFTAVYFWIFGNPYDYGFNERLGLIGWIFVISLGIGIVNLLPLGPMDGGRMYLLALEKLFDKKRVQKIASATTFVLFFCLIILILFPIAKAIFL